MKWFRNRREQAADRMYDKLAHRGPEATWQRLQSLFISPAHAEAWILLRLGGALDGTVNSGEYPQTEQRIRDREDGFPEITSTLCDTLERARDLGVAEEALWKG